MADIWVISGIPGVGKTTTAQALAKSFPRSAHVEGDVMHSFVVNGFVHPGGQPEDEAVRQLNLCQEAQSVVARAYADAEFTTIVDYVIWGRQNLAHFRRHRGEHVLRFVMLHADRDVVEGRDAERPAGRQVAERFAYLEAGMERELGDVGLWLDTSGFSVEATVQAILARADEAEVDP